MTWLLGLLGKFKLPLLGGLAAAVLLFGAYQTGVNTERARGEANVLRQQIETMKADERLAETARRSSAAKSAELEALATQQKEQLDALRKALAGRPEGDRRPATDADLDLIYGRAQ